MINHDLFHFMAVLHYFDSFQNVGMAFKVRETRRCEKGRGDKWQVEGGGSIANKKRLDGGVI